MDRKAEPPFSGRKEELCSLESKLGQAATGHGSVVCIGGPAGIGKTRLCEVIESKAMEEGCTVLVGRCLPGPALPYLPFIDAFRSLDVDGKSDGAPGREGQAAGPGRSRSSLMDLQASSERSLFQLLKVIQEASSQRTLVLRLEDLHWGDSSSIQALHFLSRTAVDLRLLVLATYRPEDLVKDRSGGLHPLSEHLVEMRREGHIEDLSLSPLNSEEVRGILEALLSAGIEENFLRSVVAESEGNPLYVIELVRYLIEDDRLLFERGGWSLGTHDLPKVPKTIQEIILRRIERLTFDERRVLESASVVGHHIVPEILAEVMGRPLPWVLDGFNSLEDEHGLLIHSGREYHFSHEKLKRVVYENISAIRRRELHLRIGLALERSGNIESKLSELAGHYCRSNQREKCLLYSFQAGEMCWKNCAFPEATPLLAKVVELTDDDEIMSEIRSLSLEYLGDADYQQGRFSDALSRYLECSQGATGPRRPHILRKLAECWLMGHLGSDMLLSNCLIEEAAACPQIDPVELGEIHHFQARAARFAGSLDEADAYYSLAEGQFQDPTVLSRLAFEIEEHAYLKTYQERYDEAFVMLEQVLELLDRAPFPTAEIETRWSLGAVHFVKGQYEEAINQLVRGANLAYKIGDHQNLRWCYYYLGFIYEQMGDRDTAIRYLNISIEENLREKGQYHFMAPVLLAHLLLLTGRTMEAASIVDQARDVIDERYQSINTPLKGMTKIVEGEILARKGMLEISDVRFKEGFILFNGTLEGSNYDAIAHVWYGDVLEAEDRRMEAIASYRHARASFEANQNLCQAERLAKLIEGLERATASTSSS